MKFNETCYAASELGGLTELYWFLNKAGKNWSCEGNLPEGVESDLIAECPLGPQAFLSSTPFPLDFDWGDWVNDGMLEERQPFTCSTSSSLSSLEEERVWVGTEWMEDLSFAFFMFFMSSEAASGGSTLSIGSIHFSALSNLSARVFPSSVKLNLKLQYFLAYLRI